MTNKAKAADHLLTTESGSSPAPYRPSNGSEGRDFDKRFCDRCKRDEAYRVGLGHSSLPDADGCEILAAALAFGADETPYPKEWIEDASGPRCTAFDPVDDQ